MMEVLVMFIVAALAMALAFHALLRIGFMAGEAEFGRKVGLITLSSGMVLTMVQAALWVICGLFLGRIFA